MNLKQLFLATVMLCSGAFVYAQPGVRKAAFNLSSSGLAINGYDPVSYFSTGEPVKGNKEISLLQEGVTYYFSTDANRKKFAASPAKYEPQYGGWCAYAMGNNGSKVDVDPKTFKILDGRLFLFYNKWLTNTLKSWNKNENNLKKNADSNWSKIFN
jgi:YHS domain-containing protein